MLFKAYKRGCMTFKKGEDPNRYSNHSGVMEFHKEVASRIRGRCMSVVEFMFDTVENEEAPLKLRLKAAKECLDRGLGRPIDCTVLVSMDQDTMKPVDQMTDAELFKLAATLTPTHQNSDESVIIDAEFTET